MQDCVAGIEQWDEVYPTADTITNDISRGTLDVLGGDNGVAACITTDPITIRCGKASTGAPTANPPPQCIV